MREEIGEKFDIFGIKKLAMLSFNWLFKPYKISFPSFFFVLVVPLQAAEMGEDFIIIFEQQVPY